MGEGYLALPNVRNPLGYYEDVRWQVVMRATLGSGYWPKRRAENIPKAQAQWRALTAVRAQCPLWGFKDTRSAWVVDDLLPCLPETRVVEVRRDREAAARSLQKHSETAYHGKRRLTRQQADAAIERWEEAMAGAMSVVQAAGLPVYTVRYEALLKSGNVNALAEFCYEGLAITCSDKELKAAQAFIHREMNHWT